MLGGTIKHRPRNQSIWVLLLFLLLIWANHLILFNLFICKTATIIFNLSNTLSEKKSQMRKYAENRTESYVTNKRQCKSSGNNTNTCFSPLISIFTDDWHRTSSCLLNVFSSWRGDENNSSLEESIHWPKRLMFWNKEYQTVEWFSKNAYGITFLDAITLKVKNRQVIFQSFFSTSCRSRSPHWRPRDTHVAARCQGWVSSNEWCCWLYLHLSVRGSRLHLHLVCRV